MLKVSLPRKVKFICAFIYSKEETYNSVCTIMSSKFGAVDYQSPPIKFNFTQYYNEEMGLKLTRRFISFSRLRDITEFVSIKLYSIRLERKFAVNSKREINIDPGYINEAKLVLTTTKDFSHRIYLKKGIYAEVTLRYVNSGFQELPTTFPDYKTETYKEVFLDIRKIYKEQIKNNLL
ncbi:MAG: DUF4416 family protein [Candidatus Omnitrophota bacterium]